MECVIMTEETLGQKIKRLRDAAGISQRKLAIATGIDLSYINQLENDRRGGITMTTAAKLAQALNTTADVFLNGQMDAAPLDRPFSTLMVELERKYNEAETKQLVKLPVLGSVSAGVLEMREQNKMPTNYVEILRSRLDSSINLEQLYALEVKGNSLEGDNIFDGDYVVIQRDAIFIDSKIYVVKIDNEVVLKHVSMQGDMVKLWSTNSHYKEQIVNASKVEIQGRAIKKVSDEDL